MSAPPRKSSRLSSHVAAAAASPPSPQPGDKRRADDSTDDSADPSSAPADRQHAASAVSDSTNPAATAPSLSLFSPAPASSAAAAAASAPASAAAAAAAASSLVDARKRHKQATDASSAVGSAAALPAAPPSRWSGLYSDALHSVLGFASLSELSRVLAVSRRWSDAVSTMPSMHATNRMGGVFEPHRLKSTRAGPLLQLTILPALRSGLAHHVSSFGSSHSIESVPLAEAVAQHMPWLRMLRIQLGEQPNEEPPRLVGALGRFRSLTTLQIRFGQQHHSWDARACNSIIAAIGGLHTLVTVMLYLDPNLFPLLSFAPLIGLQSLRTLMVQSAAHSLPSCSNSQVAEFRSMRSLTALDVQTDRSAQTAFLVRLLQPGHALQLAYFMPHITELTVTEPLAAVLGSMTSLEALCVSMQCSNIGFFSQLTRLADVWIDGRSDEHVAVDSDELVRALSHCTQLNRLSLARLQLRDEDLAKLLPCFPELTSLSLAHSSAVESLCCFDTPALAASLTLLSIDGLSQCPPSELVHLLNLRSLRSLDISDLADSVSDELKAQFAVPSQRFPFLDSVSIE